MEGERLSTEGDAFQGQPRLKRQKKETELLACLLFLLVVASVSLPWLSMIDRLSLGCGPTAARVCADVHGYCCH